MLLRNYIELGVIIVLLIVFIVIKLKTRKAVKKMDGMKGSSNASVGHSGKLAGKLGEKKK